jgi:hypothetical protein
VQQEEQAVFPESEEQQPEDEWQNAVENAQQNSPQVAENLPEKNGGQYSSQELSGSGSGKAQRKPRKSGPRASSGGKVGRPSRPYHLVSQFPSQGEYDAWWSSHKRHWRRIGGYKSTTHWACPYPNLVSAKIKGLLFFDLNDI